MNGYEKSVCNIAESLEKKEGSFLVTGATGLIGRCIIDILVCANKSHSAKFEIYALSRDENRIIELFGENVIPIIQNVQEPLELSIHYDYIIHAASNADPTMYFRYPVETILVNLEGTKNILNYCANHLETKLLFTSSFEVYGYLEEAEVYYEDMTGNLDFRILRNGYPESKRCAEALINSFVHEYGVKAVIARLGSIYGPTMKENDSKAHAQFIRKALCYEDIVLKSQGTQKRSYCYVLDAASALFTVLFKGKNGEVYNISNENSITNIAEVANICAQIAGTRVVYKQPSEMESRGYSRVQNCVLDNRKLKALGWRGKYNLYEGLNETINILRE